MEDYLAHHGVKGQKWGVRRYQNPDGTLTNAGVGAAISGVTIKKENTNNNKIIRKYREEHPNSELTANQIIKMHELGQI